MRISAVILAKNEEKNIKEAIKSVGFCNEVIVVDDNSRDRTREIAEGLGCVVYIRSLNADFAGQRNFGLEKAKGEWVLFIDADEVVTPELKREIKSKLSKPSQVKGYFLIRVDNIWGKRFYFGESSSIRLLRLARKGSGLWKRRVHESWEIEGFKKNHKNPVIHYPHPDLSKFIEEVNFYTSLHAEENAREGKNSSILKIIFWPKLKFFQNFILRLGIFDGTFGFVTAVIMSFHSFLAWSKLWLRQRKNL